MNNEQRIVKNEQGTMNNLQRKIFYELWTSTNELQILNSEQRTTNNKLLTMNYV